MVTLRGARGPSTAQLSLRLSHRCSANEGLKGQSATTKGTLWDQGVPISYCEEGTTLLDVNAPPMCDSCPSAGQNTPNANQTGRRTITNVECGSEMEI